MHAVPDLQSFRRLVAAADTVAVYREIAADALTAIGCTEPPVPIEEIIAAMGIPALQAQFMPLDTSEQAFAWGPL